MSKGRVGQRRRWSLIMLVGILALAVAACGGPAKPAEAPKAATPAASPTPSASPSPAPSAPSAAAPSPAPKAAAPPIKWEYSTIVGLTHPIGMQAVELAKRIKEQTGGRLDVTVRAAGELPYNPSEMLRVVGNNSVQMGDASVVAGDSRMQIVSRLPFMVENLDDLTKAYGVLKDYYGKDYGRFGARLLYEYTWPYQNVFGRGKAVESVDDFKSRTVRQLYPEHGAMITRFGGVPVTFATAEVPTALQRGVMDMVLTAAFNVQGSKWYEFLQWGYMLEFGLNPSQVVVSQKAYDALPADVRQQLDKVVQEYSSFQTKQIMDIDNQARKEMAEKNGMKFIPAKAEDRTRARNLMKAYWDEWGNAAEPLVKEALAKTRAALNK